MSTQPRFDGGKCWSKGNDEDFDYKDMLSHGVHNYILLAAGNNDKPGSKRIASVQYQIYSADIRSTVEKVWDSAVEKAIRTSVAKPTSEAFITQSEGKPTDANQNADAKLAALVMFGADYQKKTADPLRDGITLPGEWVNTSENPLTFHNVQDDKDMIVEEINKCAYKADINVKTPFDFGDKKRSQYRYVTVFDFNSISDIIVSNDFGDFTIQGHGKNPICHKFWEADGGTRYVCDEGNPGPDDVYIMLDGGASAENVWDGIVNFFGNVCQKRLHRARG